MGQRVSRAKKATGSECVYNSHPRAPLQTNANAPNPPQLEERRASIAEVDGGEREEREEKRVRKKRRFWRRLFCFHFSRPRAGKGEKARDHISLEHITCTVEDCDHQGPPRSSPDALKSSEEQEMQELLQPRVQDSPVILSEGEIESPQTEQQDDDVSMSIEEICSKYNIGNKLGEGGFGAVYAGVRFTDNLPVALKLARKPEAMEYINIPDHPKLIPLEIGLTVLANKGPSTPHIIKLLEWQDLPNHYIMVLQRPSPCVNLFEFLQSCGGIFNEEIARHVMRQVVEAANSCCSQGVFHRDIKEENILVNTDTLEVTLIDFGCGDLLYETAYHTFSDLQIYFLQAHCSTAPPEYFKTGKYYGRQATVFSLGVLLYSMVCGYFPDQSDQDKLKDWLWYLPSLTKECSHLINACLHPEPEERIHLDRLLLHDWFKIIP
ncbi:hypothetical protein ABG768_025177 [Culter alburnus]|uniref:non-specific serine/threonine protein kinase n=1 Tax=Culter alburnus TaxID=194366 RepID=A0AAW2AGV3_CULAL